MSAALVLARDVSAEVWSTEGLGESCRLIYEALALSHDGAPEVHVSVIAARVSRCDRTVSRMLTRLKALGLARSVDGARWSAEYRSAEDLAFELGIAGTAEARKSHHARERRDDAVRQVLARLKRADSATNGGPPTNGHRQRAAPQTQNHSQNPQTPVPSDPLAKPGEASATGIKSRQPPEPIYLPTMPINPHERGLN